MQRRVTVTVANCCVAPQGDGESYPLMTVYVDSDNHIGEAKATIMVRPCRSVIQPKFVVTMLIHLRMRVWARACAGRTPCFVGAARVSAAHF